MLSSRFFFALSFTLAASLLTGSATADTTADRLQGARQKLLEMKKLRAAQAAKGPQKKSNTALRSFEPFSVSINAKGVLGGNWEDIGYGYLACEVKGDNHFAVTLASNAEFRRDKIIFKVVREFSLDGDRVTFKKDNVVDEFNPTAAKYQKKIINCVALAYLIKYRTPTQGAPVSYKIDDRVYTLAFARTAKNIEVSLKDADGSLGKFFLTERTDSVHPFDRFRIYTRDKVAVNFQILDKSM